MRSKPGANRRKGITPGWRFLWNARKAHWFSKDGRSECGKWLFMGSAEPSDTVLIFGSDTCKACARKLGIDLSEAFNG